MRAPWSRSKPATAPIAVAGGAPAADQRHLFEREPEATGEPLWVAIDQLDADDANPRTEVLPHELDELAADIASRGVLQPIVVAPGDVPGRYRIRFGAMRWRAARQAGLQQVPITLSTRPLDPYDQVAENLKRHPLLPRDLARFIAARIDAGEPRAAIAKGLGIDPTTVAHHLDLLALPPALDEALASGRCTSPRTLHELGKLHANDPLRVEDLLASDRPITREAVAALRDTAAAEVGEPNAGGAASVRPDRVAQMLSRSQILCERLDASVARLLKAGDRVALDDLAALRQRVAALAHRLGCGADHSAGELHAECTAANREAFLP